MSEAAWWDGFEEKQKQYKINTQHDTPDNTKQIQTTIGQHFLQITYDNTPPPTPLLHMVYIRNKMKERFMSTVYLALVSNVATKNTLHGEKAKQIGAGGWDVFPATRW